MGYDWSACAMLAVMHYFAAAPFKRLESLHEGWGIPLADANLWRVVDVETITRGRGMSTAAAAIETTRSTSELVPRCF